MGKRWIQENKKRLPEKNIKEFPIKYTTLRVSLVIVLSPRLKKNDAEY
jgi:hypothetical protein